MGRSILSQSAISKRMRASDAPSAALPAASPRNHLVPHQPARAPGQVRIIGGQWRRRLLPVASGKGVPEGLRPTPDRVRETLFNWLGQDLAGWQCWDVCAGTGALGLEAASRGASQVVLGEVHAALVRQLKSLADTLGATQVQVRQTDALAFLRDMAAQGKQCDVLLLDPPYAAEWYAAALQAALPVVRSGGYLYLEAGRPWADDELAALGWQRYRYLKAGQVHAHLLQPAATPA